MKRIYYWALSALFALTPILASAQTDVGIKTNLLSDAVLNPSLGVEIGVAPRWSVDLEGSVNFWKLSNGHRWKHWLVQPEMRYWFCDAITGHFLGLHLLAGNYNIAGVNLNPLNFLSNGFYVPDTRNYGWMVGAGIGYGYSWALSRHWNLEAELGLGYAYGRYDRFPCAQCGTKIESGSSVHYVGPTKTALNLVYVF